MTKTNIAEKGAIIQRDLETFSISPHIPGGFADPAQLRKIADVAEKYNAKFVKLTGSQRIAIIGIKEDDLDKAWAEFTDQSKAIGQTIRSIKICPGTRACKKARQDSPALGFALDKEFYGKSAPAKFKMGVSGCPNCCSDSWMKDIGFFGTDTGYTVIAGGKGGGKPKVGRVVAEGLTEDQALILARKAIAFHQANGKFRERLGDTIDRVGFDTFAKAVQ
ncbi:MAG: NAD(P)/FAD-dependent oxidoreductase [Methanomicrobiales archaeon HGW-Methanomicrobiales-1]|jgi:NAD(P)H-nitrite reductase large subunit|nr:MAG: NAD(P)/FAD-dependent oxidoreductase [Methanomicrobiales archaeon HGW-Methanomicrobiales-1]